MKKLNKEKHMSKQYLQVVEFNREILGIGKRPISTLSQAEADISYASLIEECNEFLEAYKNDDFIGTVDAVIDLMYFAHGVLYKMGIDHGIYEKLFSSVHDANMSKRLGVNTKRGNGEAADAVKPDGWVSPETRIANILSAIETQNMDYDS